MSEEMGSGFSVWGVLKKSVEIIKNDLSYYLLLMVAFTALMLLINSFLFGGVDFTDPDEVAARFSSNYAGMAVFYIFSIFIYLFYYIIIIDKTNALLNDYSFENYPYISRCLSLSLPVFGVYLIYGIAMAVGFILLIIPGFIVFTVFYLSMPAKVIENIGIIESMSRSKDLTKGYRCSIMGITLIPYLFFACIYMIYTYNVVSSIQETGDINSAFSTGYQIFGALLNAAFYTFYIVSSTVVYHELVKGKEGI